MSAQVNQGTTMQAQGPGDFFERIGSLVLNAAEPGRALSLVEGAGLVASQLVGPSKHVDLCQRVAELLAEAPAAGRFQEVCTLPSGRNITHGCSQAAGLAWLSQQQKYRALNGEPPAWLACLHPSHRTQLCRLALAEGLVLKSL